MSQLMAMQYAGGRSPFSIITHTRQWRRRIFHDIGRTFMPGFGISRVKEHRVSRIVPFSPAQLYDVVADVSKYKRFVPFCEDSVVLRQPSPKLMMAQLSVGFTVFNEKYTSRVTLDRPHAIRIVAVDSRIFNSLESSWVFKPGPTRTSTHVDFSVRFEVANPMASAAIDVVFADVVQKQIQAFEDRCTQVYGIAVGLKSPPANAASPNPHPPNPPPQSRMPSEGPAPASAAAQPIITQHDIEAALTTACSSAAPASQAPPPSLIDLPTFKAACLALARGDSTSLEGTHEGLGRLCADPALLAAAYTWTQALVLMSSSHGPSGSAGPAVSSPSTGTRKRPLPPSPLASEQGVSKDSYVAGSALSILMSEEDGSWSPLQPQPPPRSTPAAPPPPQQSLQVEAGWQRRRMAAALSILVGDTRPKERAAFLFDCLDREGRGSVTENDIEEAVRAFEAAWVDLAGPLDRRKTRSGWERATKALKGWAKRAVKDTGGRISREAWIAACAKDTMLKDWVPLDGLRS